MKRFNVKFNLKNLFLLHYFFILIIILSHAEVFAAIAKGQPKRLGVSIHGSLFVPSSSGSSKYIYSEEDYGKALLLGVDYEFYKRQSEVYYEKTEISFEKSQSSEGGFKVKNNKKTLQQWIMAATQTHGALRCLFGFGLGFGLNQFENEYSILSSKTKTKSQWGEPQFGWMLNAKFNMLDPSLYESSFSPAVSSAAKNLEKFFFEISIRQIYGSIYTNGSRYELLGGFGYFF